MGASEQAAKSAWIGRVLGVDVGPGAATPKRAPAPGISYRMLLLRWREAQGRLDENLKSFGTTLLARPEIQADPRLDDIRRGVAALPKLIPTFGGQLEDVLDAGLSAADPQEHAKLSAQGIAAIDIYRKQLAAASPLLDLEDFAARKLGANLALHKALDQALDELRQQLSQ